VSKDKSYSLALIAKYTDSKIVGDEDFIVDNLSTLDNATESSITFLANSKYKKNLKKS
jgi:UDP-3-O-[3-hydroxymyristoyl] glucosamine N-acyltransferase